MLRLVKCCALPSYGGQEECKSVPPDPRKPIFTDPKSVPLSFFFPPSFFSLAPVHPPFHSVQIHKGRLDEAALFLGNRRLLQVRPSVQSTRLPDTALFVTVGTGWA